jgi:cleavage stimulation factor subunit 3
MWLEYITWLEERARPLDACSVCERAAEALPECLSLRLLRADLLEATGEHERAKESLESLLGELEQQALIASDKDDELLGQQNERADNATAGNHDSSEGTQAVEENDEEREKHNHIALAYIHYMRLLRRTEGRESARKLFAVARKERHCRWEVYAAAAELEYRTESDTRISKNIFELGLKRFGHRAEYALHYADFLTRVNDLGNARALFERALELVDHGRVKEIWDRCALSTHCLVLFSPTHLSPVVCTPDMRVLSTKTVTWNQLHELKAGEETHWGTRVRHQLRLLASS